MHFSHKKNLNDALKISWKVGPSTLLPYYFSSFAKLHL